MATFEMAPTLHVLVYRFHNDELLSAISDIQLKEDLNNYLKLKVSSKQVRPGDNVTIDIFTNPNSYVGLLGVDQSVLLLKKSDPLSVDEALQAIDSGRSTYYSSSVGTYMYNFPHFLASIPNKHTVQIEHINRGFHISAKRSDTYDERPN